MKVFIFLVALLVLVEAGKKGKKCKKGKSCWYATSTTAAPTTTPTPRCNCDLDTLRSEILAEMRADLDAVEASLTQTSEVVERIANPDVFSCKRMGGWSDETIPVPYTACDVHLPSDLVDIGTGKFTVQTDGVYRLTFTSRMSAMDGQTIRADLYVNGVLIGRAVNALDTFDSTTNTSMPFTSDLETTSTLDQLYELSAGDEVYMMIDYVGSMSMIQSSSKYQIFFTGEWIRDTTDTDLVSGTPTTTTPAPTPAPRVTTVAPVECMTVSGNTPNLPCVFPFTFDGVSYSSCIVEGFPNPWCSTETDSQGTHVTGKWGDCDLDNCPVA
jgi:hypothetical protein